MRESSGRVVALTGAASFLGRNLALALDEDEATARVVTIDVKLPSDALLPSGAGPTSYGKKTRAYAVDLTSAGADARVAEVLAAERVDTLVHLAFLSSPTRAAAWAHELESVGTMHLMNGARRSPPRKLVLWSQTSLYGALPTNPNFLTERHPLRADPDEPYFADKIAAEREAAAFAAKAKGTVVTVLRTAPIVGPTVRNFVTRYLGSRGVITLLGFDPLWQFLHEVDAITAFKLVVDRDHPGTFNVVGDGVLPLSTIIKLAGRTALPTFPPLAKTMTAALWAAGSSPVPPSFLRYLRYICVADGDKAARALGFTPAYSTREALLDCVSAQRLREVGMLRQPGDAAV